MIEGVVANVVERLAMTELAVAATAGDGTFTVVDPDILEADGGSATMGFELLTYTSVDEAGLVTLKGTLLGSYAVGQPLIVYPHHTERWAHIREHGSEDFLEVRVPHNLYERLTVGVRDSDDGELIESGPTPDGDDLTVTDVVAIPPAIDSEYLVTSNLEQAAVSGLVLTGSYQALDGEVTLSPDSDSLAVVEWGISVEFDPAPSHVTIDSLATGVLLVDGTPAGLERTIGFTGQFDTGVGPSVTMLLTGLTVLSLIGGQDYTVAMGVKAAVTTGSVKVPVGKGGGLSYYYVGG